MGTVSVEGAKGCLATPAAVEPARAPMTVDSKDSVEYGVKLIPKSETPELAIRCEADAISVLKFLSAEELNWPF